MAEVIRQSYFEIEGNHFIDRGRSTVIAEKGRGRHLKRLGLFLAVFPGVTALGYYGVQIATGAIIGVPPEALFVSNPAIDMSKHSSTMSLAALFGGIGGMTASIPITEGLERLFGISANR